MSEIILKNNLKNNLSKTILTKLEIENEITHHKKILYSSIAESLIAIIVDDINQQLFETVEERKKLDYRFNIKLNSNKILPYLMIYVTDQYWDDIAYFVVDLFNEKKWNLGYKLVYNEHQDTNLPNTKKGFTEIIFYEV